MYKKPSKKRQLIQRMIVLAGMVLSVIIIVTATILFILGYRIDSDNGRIEQGALVQFNSVPTGARVSMDGTPLNIQTPGKRTVIDGMHTFMMERADFRTWEKSLELSAGTLTWLDYVRLVPTDIQREVVREYQAVVGVKAAPDRQTLVIQTDSSQPILDLVDIRQPTIQTSDLIIPDSLYSEAINEDIQHQFILDTWDPSGRYLLIEHRYNDSREWLVVDTDDVERSQNLTRLLSIDVASLQFSGSGGSTLYGLSDGTVRRLDLSSGTISRALVSQVQEFTLYDTNIFTYVGRDTETNEVLAGLYRDGDSEPVILRRAPVETQLRIDTAQHYNDRYILLSEDLAVTLLRGDYPRSTEDTSSLSVEYEFMASAPISQLNFSPGGDYAFVQSGADFASYEVEYGRFNTSRVNNETAQTQSLRWLDDAYLWSTEQNVVSLREFDGNYTNQIIPSVAGFDITLSQNGRYLYAIVQTEAGYQLERAILIPQ